jgi:hypothetical protein
MGCAGLLVRIRGNTAFLPNNGKSRVRYAVSTRVVLLDLDSVKNVQMVIS